jgi:hypothetical protein
MHVLVIERYRGGDPAPVYRRLRDGGRRIPAGVAFVSSWVTDDLTTCYQVMQCDQRSSLDPWIEYWSDLVDFVVIPVVTSDEARERALAE